MDWEGIYSRLGILWLVIGFYTIVFALLGLVLRYSSEKEKNEDAFNVFVVLGIVNFLGAVVYVLTGWDFLF